MVLFRASRHQRGPDRWLAHKMVIFAAGAVIGFAGMITERSWLVNAGIVVLVIGVALRFIGSGNDTIDDIDEIREVDEGDAEQDDPDRPEADGGRGTA